MATTTTTATQKGNIVPGGMGGFLNPPGHPKHSFHVETDLRRRPDNRTHVCLSSAADCKWLSRETRHAARRLLNQWRRQRPELNDPIVQDWICHVLGYFRSCYVRPYCDRSADRLLISRDLDPLANSHMHAGVAFIRDFYPEFHPDAKHFSGAYWGKKPA